MPCYNPLNKNKILLDCLMIITYQDHSRPEFLSGYYKLYSVIQMPYYNLLSKNKCLQD